MSKKTIYILLGISLLLGAGSLWWTQNTTPPTEAPQNARQTPSQKAKTRLADATSKTTPKPSPRCAWSAGTGMSFSFTSTDKIEIHSSGLSGTTSNNQLQKVPNTHVDVEVSGQLHAFVMSVTSNQEAIAAVRLSPYKIQTETEGVDETWLEEIQKPLFVRLDERCRLVASARHKNTNLVAHARAVSFLENLDFSSPPPNAQNKPYTTRHQSEYGTLYAHNVYIPGQGRGAIERKDIRYAPTHQQRSNVRVHASRNRIDLRNAPWFDQQSIQRSLEIRNHGRPFLSSSTSLEIQSIPTNNDAFRGLSLQPGEFIWGKIDPKALALAEKNRSHGQLAGMSVEDALDRFLATRDSGLSGAWFESQRLLQAWMVLNPEGVQKLAAAMIQGEYDESTQSHFTFAMAKSGSPVAREMLENIAEDPGLGENIRVQATANLADIAEPTEETLAVLTSLSKRDTGKSQYDLVGSTATMTLGSLIHEHRGNPELTAQIQEHLQTLLHSDREQTVIEALYAVGNSGQEDFLERLVELSSHHNPKVRVGVVNGMRRMPRNATSDVQADILRDDTSAPVIIELAISHQENLTNMGGLLTPTEINLYRTKLPSAPIPVRTEIIKALGTVSFRQPEAHRVLVSWFPHEKAHSIRVLLGRYLKPGDFTN